MHNGKWANKMAIRIKITYAPSVENSKINYINSNFGDINNISNPNLLRIFN